ncbi:LOW QUALITY PROTEIN: hypothetical protein U9M48_038179 [Paspalum notatum var. saurae]|uniref:Uncharacterized protein n=1 Tax=Paspalum notatum var. saurae TaxID=547442 RepID=A0AAQ3UI03_PASNO
MSREKGGDAPVQSPSSSPISCGWNHRRGVQREMASSSSVRSSHSTRQPRDNPGRGVLASSADASTLGAWLEAVAWAPGMCDALVRDPSVRRAPRRRSSRPTTSRPPRTVPVREGREGGRGSGVRRPSRGSRLAAAWPGAARDGRPDRGYGRRRGIRLQAAGAAARDSKPRRDERPRTHMSPWSFRNSSLKQRKYGSTNSSSQYSSHGVQT